MINVIISHLGIANIHRYSCPVAPSAGDMVIVSGKRYYVTRVDWYVTLEQTTALVVVEEA